jgi:DNA primase
MEPRYDGPYDSPVAKLWYNWDRWEEGQEVVICEGPFDVMKLHQNGVYAICALGKNISDIQINLLTSRFSSVTLMPDPDRTSKLKDEWHFLSRYLNVNIVPLLGTKDPGEMNKEETQEVMKTSFDNMRDMEWHRFESWKATHKEVVKT